MKYTVTVMTWIGGYTFTETADTEAEAMQKMWSLMETHRGLGPEGWIKESVTS